MRAATCLAAAGAGAGVAKRSERSGGGGGGATDGVAAGGGATAGGGTVAGAALGGIARETTRPGVTRGVKATDPGVREGGGGIDVRTGGASFSFSSCCRLLLKSGDDAGREPRRIAGTPPGVVSRDAEREGMVVDICCCGWWQSAIYSAFFLFCLCRVRRYFIPRGGYFELNTAPKFLVKS